MVRAGDSEDYTKDDTEVEMKECELEWERRRRVWKGEVVVNDKEVEM